MSVMIVSEETYRGVARTLEYNRDYGQKSGIKHHVQLNVAEFVEDLRMENYRSYIERYSHDDVEYMPIKNITNGDKVNDAQLLKSLTCIEYQIEQDHPHKERLSALIRGVMMEIVSSSPEWDSAKWG